MSIAPIPWVPSRASQPGSDIPGKMLANVMSGDWICVRVSFRTGNTAVAFAPDLFLIHVIYTPDSDDAIPHEDQSTTYGGSLTSGTRRRNYHIDTDWTFQVPWNGQISIVAGGDSDAARCITDVVLVRGFTPRDYDLQRQLVMSAQMETLERVAYGDPHALVQLQNAHVGPAPRFWAPPVVNTPQLVPATWVNIPAGTALPFPDGAVKIETVPAPGALTSTRFTIAVMGNVLALDAAPGIPEPIGTYGQGNACTDGVAATWAPAAPVQKVTIWSSLGG